MSPKGTYAVGEFVNFFIVNVRITMTRILPWCLLVDMAERDGNVIKT